MFRVKKLSSLGLTKGVNMLRVKKPKAIRTISKVVKTTAAVAKAPSHNEYEMTAAEKREEAYDNVEFSAHQVHDAIDDLLHELDEYPIRGQKEHIKKIRAEVSNVKVAMDKTLKLIEGLPS